jgi:holin-like protein
MIRGMAVLLGFLFAGEVISAVLNVPIPGNVIGMGLLLAALCARIVREEWVREAAELLLSHLALFFVPAGVGVMVYFDLIGREWLPIVSAMVLSTFAVMAVTGWVEERLEKRGGESRVE